MSESNPFGFGKFVPGFDFLQNLASSAVKGASQGIPQLPNLANWVAPTMNVEELDKRIDELKAVQFWLDQNARALAATIQALEVQKMTLATLKGMNFNMGDVANAFKLKTADAMAAGVQNFNERAAAAAEAPAPAPAPAPKPEADQASGDTKAQAVPGVADPMQWWGALTQQFQQIATSALKDAAASAAVDTTRNMATGLAKEAIKTAAKTVAAGLTPRTPSTPAATKKAPAKKAAAKKVPTRRTGS
jgi:ribosomal protein L29